LGDAQQRKRLHRQRRTLRDESIWLNVSGGPRAVGKSDRFLVGTSEGSSSARPEEEFHSDGVERVI